MKKYYEAYDERYKTAHLKGISWSGTKSSPVVMDTIRKYKINTKDSILEIGCGEGRDAKAVLEAGYNLLATDISKEAIKYCKNIMSLYKNHFEVLDCINGSHQSRYNFIYAVAVIHMLVLEEDRNAFYRFIKGHLKESGIALVCTMGDGNMEMMSDTSKAFEIQEREHVQGKMEVAATSCRMVSFKTFMHEIELNGLVLIEKGITAALPDFDKLMFAVVK